jgi:uncharacterized protein (DUF4415 family)
MDMEHAERVRLARAKALKSAEEMSDEEDAAITAAALADPDNPPLTDKFWSRARPAVEVRPELVARLEAARKSLEASGRIMTGMAIDPDVLAHYRALGDDCDRAVNAALRRAANLPEPELAKQPSPALSKG